MKDFFVALGLVLVIEGVLLAAFPERLRQALEAIQNVGDQSLRLYGLAAAIAGIGVIWFIRAAGLF